MNFVGKIDPKGLVFQDSGDKKSSWIQIFRKGEWKHPRYGKLKFTDEVFQGFIKNFNDRVRGVDIALDADHESSGGALGWFRQLEQRGDGLWGLVEWTSRGLQLVADGIYRYTSGDFDFEWKSEETGKVYKNCLFGVAATNRPFIKNMSQINLSEFREELENNEDVRNAFQLAEDVLKLKQGDTQMKTDAELKKMKPEDMTPEEKKRHAELMKEDEVILAKKKLAERATAVGLAEDSTEEIVLATESLFARAKAVGLKPDATLLEIEAAEKKAADEKKALSDYTARCVRVGLKEPVEKVVLETAEKLLSERAKKVELAETATIEEVMAREKKLAEQIGNENEQTVKVAVALGLSQTSTLQEIYAAASQFVTSVRKMIGNPGLAERAKKMGLSETAKKEEIELKEQEAEEKRLNEEADTLMKADLPVLEKKLSELRESKADAFTIKFLEETISSRKKLQEEQIKNAKEKIELKLKEHFKGGKLTPKERDTLKAILFSELDSGETSFKLSEKDQDGRITEATKTLSEILDGMLSDRPAIVELKEIAAKEITAPAKENPKELSEEEASEAGKRVASKVTGMTKSAKQLAERAKAVGLPASAKLSEIEAKEQK
jgi:hypothetical protein